MIANMSSMKGKDREVSETSTQHNPNPYETDRPFRFAFYLAGSLHFRSKISRSPAVEDYGRYRRGGDPRPLERGNRVWSGDGKRGHSYGFLSVSRSRGIPYLPPGDGRRN